MATTQQYGLGPFTYPRGWFAVASAADVQAKPVAAHFFGRDFVIYRTQGGRPAILDAYCPHMGTHLASGPNGASARRNVLIEGDTIRCPLHGWRFGADGRCVDIPYSPIPIPPGAHLRSHACREHGGLILMWHDEEGGDPHYEPVPFPEWDDPLWIRGEIEPVGLFDMHPVEIVDHHVDKIHHVFTHGFDDVPGFVTTFADHRLSQYHDFLQVDGDGSHTHNKSTSDYRGAGIMLVRIEGPPPMVSYFSHTPVSDGRIVTWHGLAIKAAHGRPNDEDKARLDLLMPMLKHAYVEDLEILAMKRPSINPMQIPGDGPFKLVRKWYGQFYGPRAEAGVIHAELNGAHNTEGAVPAPWLDPARRSA